MSTVSRARAITRPADRHTESTAPGGCGTRCWASDLASSIKGPEFVFGVERFQRFDDSLFANLKQWSSIMSKVWLVTESASGLGRNITEAVLASGARLVATARDPGRLDDVVKKYGDQVRTALLDVADENAANSAVQAAVDAFGRLDVVVNNAGYGDIAPFEQLSSERFRAVVDTNFYGVVQEIEKANWDNQHEDLYAIGMVLGYKFAKESVPATGQLWEHMSNDQGIVVSAAKKYFQHPRPYDLDPNIKSICGSSPG